NDWQLHSWAAAGTPPTLRRWRNDWQLHSWAAAGTPPTLRRWSNDWHKLRATFAVGTTVRLSDTTRATNVTYSGSVEGATSDTCLAEQSCLNLLRVGGGRATPDIRLAPQSCLHRLRVGGGPATPDTCLAPQSSPHRLRVGGGPATPDTCLAQQSSHLPTLILRLHAQ